MFIHIPQSWQVMDGGKSLSYDSIYSEIGILNNAFKKFKYNYLYIFIKYPGDFWDDKVWEITAENYGKWHGQPKRLVSRELFMIMKSMVRTNHKKVA